MEYVDYMEKPTTFEEYNQQNGGCLVALDWDTFEAQYYNPYLMGLCGNFIECTEDEYYNALECLPPKRWTRLKNGEFFFMGECYTANLYSCYVSKGGKYYTALRSINTDSEDLINLKPVK